VYWLGGDDGDKDLEKAAQAFNIVTDEATKSPHFEVWEENWEIVEMFLRLQTQWRVGMNGRTGLDYVAAEWLFRLFSVEKPSEMLEDLQVMEAAVLDAQAVREV
jgi:hypothetical protein